MAIKLSIVDDKGVTTRYHRVCSFTVKSDIVIADVKSYVNDKVRKSENEDEAEYRYYSRREVALPYNGSDKLCFDCVYEKLLQTDEFRGGEKI